MKALYPSETYCFDVFPDNSRRSTPGAEHHVERRTEALDVVTVETAVTLEQSEYHILHRVPTIGIG